MLQLLGSAPETPGGMRRPIRRTGRRHPGGQPLHHVAPLHVSASIRENGWDTGHSRGRVEPPGNPFRHAPRAVSKRAGRKARRDRWRCRPAPPAGAFSTYSLVARVAAGLESPSPSPIRLRRRLASGVTRDAIEATVPRRKTQEPAKGCPPRSIRHGKTDPPILEVAVGGRDVSTSRRCPINCRHSETVEEACLSR